MKRLGNLYLSENYTSRSKTNRNMRVFAYRLAIIFIWIGLFVFQSNYKVQGQQEKPLNLSDITAKLTFASRSDKPIEKINEQLVKEVCNRKVDFTLTSGEESSLKKAGASDLLIRTIRENSPEETKEMILLYEKYVVTYQTPNIEQKKIALDAAKEFVRKYENSECLKEQVNYFKQAIPVIERRIKSDYEPDTIPRPVIERNKRLIGLDKAYKAENYNEFFDIAAEILKVEPDFLDLLIVLASIGFDQAKIHGKNSKFNDETIRYAELALNLLNSTQVSEYKDSGHYEYKYKSEYKDFGQYEYKYKTKTDALNKMNEIIEFMKNQKLN